MNRMKFTIVGDSQTGKTCWLSILKGDEFQKKHESKRLEPFKKKIIINQTEYELEICDTLGDNRSFDERLRIYRRTDVFIICFAVNDMISFRNVRTKWYPEIKTHRPNASIVLVCTKFDIKHKKIPYDEVQELKKRYYFSHIGYCSASSNLNVEKVFQDAIIKLCEVPPAKKPFYHGIFVRCCSKTEA